MVELDGTSSTLEGIAFSSQEQLSKELMGQNK
jgi:hypothetical protein